MATETLSLADMKAALLGYMIDLAADRDDPGTVKPDSQKLLDRSAAIMRDPHSLESLALSLGRHQLSANSDDGQNAK